MTAAPPTDQVAIWWSRHAEGYHRWGDVAHGGEAHREAWIDALARELGHPRRDGSPALRIAEVGAGTAEVTLLLARMGHDVTGYDIASGMLDVGRRRAQTEGLSVALEDGNAYALPLDDDTVDVVISRWVFWTLHDPARALREWRRVIAPGGRVVVIDTLAGAAPESVAERIHKLQGRAFWAVYPRVQELARRIRHGHVPQSGGSPTGGTETPGGRWRTIADPQAHFSEAGMSDVAQSWLDAVHVVYRRAAPLRWRIAGPLPRFFMLTWRSSS